MSGADDDDGDGSRLVSVLECEGCRATFKPEQFGCTSVHDVPPDARCPRCGGVFCIADTWEDD